jgi:putative nucleotidyltransferase with HDIG domain
MLEKIVKNYQKTNDLLHDIQNLFFRFNKMNIFEHSKNVSNKAIEMADKYGVNKDKIKIASYLHDISGIIKDEDKIAFAETMNIEILHEERIVPLVMHQKLSKEIAKSIFDINDNEILQAISCHTTLHGNPTIFDMILFIADKIEWDQMNKPPYLGIIEENLSISLEKGVGAFIKYQMDNKEKLKILHPWLIEAYKYFCEN